MIIKQVGFLAAGIWLAGTITAVAEVAPQPMEKPGMVDAASGSVTAIVQDIDYKTRMVTLKGPHGDVMAIQAPPEVSRFEEIKKGDQVTIDYLESVAVMVQAPDQAIASEEGSNTRIVRHAGKKPSGVLVQTDIITATVEKINAKKRTATLKGPLGNKFNVDISPDVQNLEKVKKGDQVLVKHTRTVALDIRKPGKK